MTEAHSSEDQQMVITFTILALCMVTTWVIYTRSYQFNYMAYGMFIPSISTFITLSYYNRDMKQFISDSFFINLDVLMQCLIASWLSGLFVLLSVGIGVMKGWTIAQKSKTKMDKIAVHKHNRNPFYAFIRAGGEELGFRCFLLPKLLNVYGTNHFFYVSSICGIIWALSHLALMIVLTKKFKTPNPIQIIVFQFVSVYVQTFFMNWLGWLSYYSWFVVTVAHFTFNQINPMLLGSVYTNTQGKYKGELWKINGEGWAGCIAGAVYIGLMYIFVDF